MALEPSWLTKHERGVMIAALSHYRTTQHAKAISATKADTRAKAGANEYVAADLLRQLVDR
jgi:hypothetical protein